MWDCSRCDPELKKLRGSCGKPFEVGLVEEMSGVEWVDESGRPKWQGARVREDGIVEVEAKATLGAVDLEGSITSCPVAACQSPDLYQIVEAYRHSQGGRLDAYEPDPSAALMTALDLLNCNLDAIDRQRIEEARAKKGGTANG